MKGWKNVGVELPPSVIAIVRAAGGDDPTKGGMPYAMASLVGALPWIAVALFESLPPEEYAEFRTMLRQELQGSWAIIGAENPKAAFDEAIARAKKSVQ